MRRILAIGGGGFLMEDVPSPIDAQLLWLTGKAKPRVCFIPTPSGAKAFAWAPGASAYRVAMHEGRALETVLERTVLARES